MSKELFVSSTPHETKVAITEDDQLAEIYFERENEYTLAGSIYKGRVTRVLPGMQSAFVEIGLERDAFLYVTDFFEQQEDEEGEFDTIPNEQTSSRRQRDDQRTQRQQPAEPAPDSVHSGEDRREISEPSPVNDRESNNAVIAPKKFTETESIQNSGAEELTAGQASGAGISAPSETAQAESREQTDRPRFGRHRRGRRGRGFPESKFDSRNAARSIPQAEPARAAERSSGRPVAPPPQNYQPIILPGESISKYKNRAEAKPADSGRDVTSYVSTNDSNRDVASNVSTDNTTADVASNVSTEENRGNQTETRRPTEEIDVTSILQKHEEKNLSVETESAPHPGLRNHEHNARFGATPGVIEEEEIEGEESEQPALHHSLEEEEYDDFEEEMLDSSKNDQPGAHNNRVPQEIEDANAPKQPENYGAAESFSSESESDSGDDSEDNEENSEEGAEVPELDEAEMIAGAGSSEAAEEAHHEMDSDGGTESARAETRGPAGYQQKVGFDRNRTRRGGRRMRPQRGGGGGRKFHRGPLPQISDLLKEGQEILVQIAKEPIGKKGARITSHIALPGRFLVYMPTVNHNGVSRKISSDEERLRLKRIIQSERQSADGGNHAGGFIVRTAAASASEEDLRADIRFLLNLWSEINGRADSSKAPALIYHDLNLVERILRDQVSEGFSHIWVDSEQDYERILRFTNRFQPSLVKRVKLYTKETPLFEQFNVQDEINKALKSKVWLKSGGYIVINQTEALVAIDVNTGKYVGKTQKLEDTIVKTNVDAIKEIVRQIRLRDLGGIIVIDFIDMDERRNRQKVMQALEEALRSDRAPSKVLQFNDFGLVAITRKRVKQSLERTLGQPCTYCTGTGLIKSVATICNEIYVEMRKMTKHLERGDVFVRVNPEVGKALKANNARWLQDMEDLTGKTVIVKPDPTLHQEQFDIH